MGEREVLLVVVVVLNVEPNRCADTKPRVPENFYQRVLQARVAILVEEFEYLLSAIRIQ